MRRLAFMGGIALLGVVLAVVLMQRPDTGEDVVVPERERSDPVVFNQPPPDNGARPRPQPAPRPSSDDPDAGGDPVVAEADVDPAEKKSSGGEWVSGSNPRAARLRERQQTPEALTSGKAAIPWTLIRRNLLRMDDENARKLGTEANQLMLDLRRNRRDPRTFDWNELEERQRSLVDEIESSPYMDDPEIADMVVRVDEILGEYEE